MIRELLKRKPSCRVFTPANAFKTPCTRFFSPLLKTLEGRQADFFPLTFQEHTFLRIRHRSFPFPREMAGVLPGDITYFFCRRTRLFSMVEKTALEASYSSSPLPRSLGLKILSPKDCIFSPQFRSLSPFELVSPDCSVLPSQLASSPATPQTTLPSLLR